MTVGELLSLFGAVALLVAGFWAVLKVALWQHEKRLDERFAAMEQARKDGRKQWEERFSVHETGERTRLQGVEGRVTAVEEVARDHERNLLLLKADLPLHYVRREDYVRNQTVIEAKLDGLALRLENLKLREANI